MSDISVKQLVIYPDTVDVLRETGFNNVSDLQEYYANNVEPLSSVIENLDACRERSLLMELIRIGCEIREGHQRFLKGDLGELDLPKGRMGTQIINALHGFGIYFISELEEYYANNEEPLRKHCDDIGEKSENYILDALETYKYGSPRVERNDYVGDCNKILRRLSAEEQKQVYELLTSTFSEKCNGGKP